MADPFVAEIRIFAGNFAPTGWAFCDGQLMPISQNTALFSLLGTTYGGNGQTTFGLPNLQGRAPMHPGQGQGLTLRDLGETGGSEAVTLLESEMPAHAHAFNVLTDPADLSGPANRTLARSRNGAAYQSSATNLVAMGLQSMSMAGGSQPHNNRQPYLGLTFIIALQGIFPARN